MGGFGVALLWIPLYLLWLSFYITLYLLWGIFFIIEVLIYIPLLWIKKNIYKYCYKKGWLK